MQSQTDTEKVIYDFNITQGASINLFEKTCYKELNHYYSQAPSNKGFYFGRKSEAKGDHNGNRNNED